MAALATDVSVKRDECSWKGNLKGKQVQQSHYICETKINKQNLKERRRLQLWIRRAEGGGARRRFL
jgi:hypothetical protein